VQTVVHAPYFRFKQNSTFKHVNGKLLNFETSAIVFIWRKTAIYDLNCVGTTLNPIKMSDILLLISQDTEKISHGHSHVIFLCVKSYFCYILSKRQLYYHAISASLSYYVSNSKLPWSSKKDECNSRVATPIIQYGHKDLKVDMNGSNTKQEVWVGYYQQTTLFEYIGKFKKFVLNNKFEMIKINVKIGKTRAYNWSIDSSTNVHLYNSLRNKKITI
jgi:hypothetical protein